MQDRNDKRDLTPALNCPGALRASSTHVEGESLEAKLDREIVPARYVLPLGCRVFENLCRDGKGGQVLAGGLCPEANSMIVRACSGDSEGQV